MGGSVGSHLLSLLGEQWCSHQPFPRIVRSGEIHYTHTNAAREMWAGLRC